MTGNGQLDVQSLIRDGSIGKAKAILEERLQNDPANKQDRLLLAICNFRLKNFDKAEEGFRECLLSDSNNVNAAYYLGLTHERQGRAQEAAMVFQTVLRMEPSHQKARSKLLQSGHYAPPDEISPQLPEQAPTANGPHPSDKGESGGGPGDFLFSGSRRLLSNGYYPIALFAVFAFLLSPVPGALGLFYRPSPPITYIIIGFLFVTLLFFILAKSTHYTIYEKRLDISKGVLFRRHKYIWLYEIKDSELTRNPWELLTNNATLTIFGDGGSQGDKKLKVKGLAGARRMREFWDELRTAVREQRGEIKKIWI